MTQPNIIVSLKLKDSKRHLGSAVAVAPNKLLTAKHVVENISRTDIQATLLSNREFLSVKHIDHHPDRDISLITLAHEHQKTVVSLNLMPVFKESLMVKLMAINTAENCVKGPYEVQLINWTALGGWEFHTVPAHGMSGGAVLLDNKLVGIIQARDNAEGSGIIIPLSEIEEFLHEHLQLDTNSNTAAAMPIVSQQPANCGEVTEVFQSGSTKNKSSKLPKLKDSEFIEQIRINMMDLLDNENVVVFRDVLFIEMNKVLIKLDQPLLINNDAAILIDGMLIALKEGGPDVPVVMNALLLATNSCLDKMGKSFRAAGKNREIICKTVLDLLGWLVVMSVASELNEQIFPDSQYFPAVYFELPVMTPWGVEVLVSRKFHRAAKLTLDGTGIVGAHLFAFNWKQSTVVNDLKLELWNKVFPDRKKTKWINDELNSDLLELNAALVAKRKNPVSPTHYYLATHDVSEFEEAYKGVCEQLLEELDELTVIRFGNGAGKQVFCTVEHSLMAAISEFLTTIKSMK